MRHEKDSPEILDISKAIGRCPLYFTRPATVWHAPRNSRQLARPDVAGMGKCVVTSFSRWPSVLGSRSRIWPTVKCSPFLPRPPVIFHSLRPTQPPFLQERN